MIVYTAEKTVLNLDTLYWATRRMIDGLLSDPEHVKKIEAWITSGDFQKQG